MSLPLHEHIGQDGFRLRGVELARIDAFSDVVFGFALTLLVVSLEVPHTFAELHESLRGFLPFAICFLFLMMVWFGHYTFFRRFGTHDFGTIVINAVLLFVVLFYVYPLKFLFTFAVFAMLNLPHAKVDHASQLVDLMVLYGVGFAAIYLLLAALYWNGYRQRIALGLNAVETFLARTYIVEAAGVAAVGLLACLIVLFIPQGLAALTGLTYMLIWPFKAFYRRYTRRHVHELQKLAPADAESLLIA